MRTLQKVCAKQSCPRCESQSFRRECNLSNPCVPGRTCIETSMHMRTTVGLTLMRSEGPLTNTTLCKSAPRTRGRHNSKTPYFDASFLKNVFIYFKGGKMRLRHTQRISRQARGTGHQRKSNQTKITKQDSEIKFVLGRIGDSIGTHQGRRHC